ncbi:hypothetical protein LCGC14_0506230 [marine sediment metagenome]|uniref:UPF0113 domain-containing protein n=1 Tax=marine sediment metagenome TaxID=412755 RepID=A0A0F9S7E5_9ZZZZ|nr:MAG: hypothetical protein Lokiarch_37440 [Candidatus Lokiarchaeum sp. GC14_75]
MKDIETFRHINVIEKQIISTSLSRISPRFLPILNEIEEYIFIKLSNQQSQINYPSLYLLSEELGKIIQNPKITNDIVAGGLYFGFLKRGAFFISLESTGYFYRNGLFPDFAYMRVNKKGEKSILYGNNIMMFMETYLPPDLKKKDFLLVFNGLMEIIAIAQSTVDNKTIKNLKPKDIIAINLSDKGLYLREKQ